ncbi:RNA helicase, partial [Vibrio parahaemolyticus]|nr:RNA helicase [Vibrio parahaemolyticus]
MAAAEQLDTSVEYEIRYFEQGKMHSMIVVAENKK